nr:immunoglobulin light chain junction region [Homo sapiens]
LLQGILCPP